MEHQDIQDKLVQAMPRVLTLCKIPHDARKLPLAFTAHPATGDVTFTFEDSTASVSIALKREEDTLCDRFICKIFLDLPSLNTDVTVALIDAFHMNDESAPYRVDMAIERGLHYLVKLLYSKTPRLPSEIKQRLDAMGFAVLDFNGCGYVCDPSGEHHRYAWNWHRSCFESVAEHVNEAIAAATNPAEWQL